MTPEQIEQFTGYFQTCWPSSRAWEAQAWTYWGEVLTQHGARSVRRALRQLIHEPSYTEFPPGLAAMIQALDEVERALRMKIRRGEEDLAVAEAADDDERAEQIRGAVAGWRDRLAQ